MAFSEGEINQGKEHATRDRDHIVKMRKVITLTADGILECTEWQYKEAQDDNKISNSLFGLISNYGKVMFWAVSLLLISKL